VKVITGSKETRMNDFAMNLSTHHVTMHAGEQQ
jgi:hypothetical protein